MSVCVPEERFICTPCLLSGSDLVVLADFFISFQIAVSFNPVSECNYVWISAIKGLTELMLSTSELIHRFHAFVFFFQFQQLRLRNWADLIASSLNVGFVPVEPTSPFNSLPSAKICICLSEGFSLFFWNSHAWMHRSEIIRYRRSFIAFSS